MSENVGTTATLSEMRSEVAREHGWHEDDDGDRIDEVLNERFGQAAVELYGALEAIHDRLSNAPDGMWAWEAYDSFYRSIVIEALAAARQS